MVARAPSHAAHHKTECGRINNRALLLETHKHTEQEEHTQKNIDHISTDLNGGMHNI